jgi:DNA-binding NtrC family response regulator
LLNGRNNCWIVSEGRLFSLGNNVKERLGVKKKLQILIIEDNADDLFRIERELKRAGLVFHAQRVTSKEEFIAEIHNQTPDLVLSDHGLPSFDGFTALDIVQKKCPEVPFIFVTGSNDHGMVAEMYESGAADYVYKNHLSDLVPAVQQALREAEERAKENETRTERELELQSRPKPMREPKAEPGSVAFCPSCKRVENHDGAWEKTEEYLLKHGQATIRLTLCPECARSGSLH